MPKNAAQEKSTSQVRMATLEQLAANVLPNFLDPVPPLRTLREWFKGVPQLKANPTARNGGGKVYYSVAGVEKFLRSRMV